ncbi:hypothetical protein VNO78_30471 [Psophocarpus tetragonolobus]|uniref:Uncharacterized protein n=1 Tax=Psophocarpus tetragonolobus TaxID=3891 RepID=A0AAN9RX44_PSOTE
MGGNPKKCGISGYWEWHFVSESYSLMMLLVARLNERVLIATVWYINEDRAENETISCVTLFLKASVYLLTLQSSDASLYPISGTHSPAPFFK